MGELLLNAPAIWPSYSLQYSGGLAQGLSLVTFSRMIPLSSERVISFWTAVERSWCTIPFGICGGLDLHVGVDRTFHVPCEPLLRSTVIVLVALAELSTSITDGINTIEKVPAVFITCIVSVGSWSLLHTLSEEGINVDKSILCPLGVPYRHPTKKYCLQLHRCT